MTTGMSMKHCNARMKRQFNLWQALCLTLVAFGCSALSSPSPPRRVALVTGANKGIGKEIARLLGETSDVTTIIASRNQALGEAAAAELGSECGPDSDIICIRLDLVDDDTIRSAAEFITKEYGHLDVLVNNAAVCFNDPTLYGAVSYTPFEQQAGITVNTNYFGTSAVTDAMLPLLQQSDSPRIINVASAAGRLSILKSPARVKQFTSESLQTTELDNLLKEFVSDAEQGVHGKRGWPNTAYGVSKLGIIAYTRILAREYPNMMVNSVDPGFCKTDQNNNQGNVDPKRGAQTPFLLATVEEGKQFITGKHMYEEREISWSYQ